MVQTELMSLSKLELNKGQIEGLPANPREIANEMLDKLKKSIIECPEMLEYREILAYPHKGKLVIIGGNMRYRAMQELGIKEAPVKVLPASLSVDKLKEITLKDNIGYGKWDWDELANNWDDCPLTDWGMPVWENVPEADTSSNNAGDTESKEKEEHGKLTDKFIVPPFSVLDTRQGYWRERKEKWAQLIGDKGESRQNTLDSETGIMNNINSGVSILDPVMAELVCRWFGFAGAKAFDCFAGDTVFGYVSASLGMEFTGIELREEQAALNNERVANISAKYIWRCTATSLMMQATSQLMRHLLASYLMPLQELWSALSQTGLLLWWLVMYVIRLASIMILLAILSVSSEHMVLHSTMSALLLSL